MSTPITTVAQLKREIAAAQTADKPLRYEHLTIPALSGERKVRKVQTQRLCTLLPEDHPRFSDAPNGSWLDFPKRDDVTFDGRTASLLRDGVVWLRITVPE